MRTKEGHSELVALAKELYEKLGSGDKVAKRLNVSHSTAYRLLGEAGVTLPDRFSREVQEKKKALHGEQAAAVARDYAEGMSIDDLKEKYGVGHYAIKTAVRDAGVPERPRGGSTRYFSEEQEDEICRLYKTGLSQVMIAAKFECHQVRISRLLMQRGIVKKEDGRPRGERHGSWKGGRHVRDGYVFVWVAPDDPMASMRHPSGYVAEHRLVVARWLDRPLTPDESVHHKSGDRSDNRLENLQLCQGKHGKGVVYQCNACGSYDVTAREMDKKRVT